MIILKLLRNSIGELLIFLNWLYPPFRVPKRTIKSQSEIDAALQNYTLYEFRRCPFCIKVRRHIKRLRLDINLKDALDPAIEHELISGGGKRKVPCLAITKNGKTQWMYESSKINQYLSQTFS